MSPHECKPLFPPTGSQPKQYRRSHHPQVRQTPLIGGTRKNAPPRSDSSQKHGPFREKNSITTRKVQRRPPRGSGLARRQGPTAPLRPGSPERRTFRLRSLPPGPGRIRPTNATTPPYEGADIRPLAPEGGPSTGDGGSYRRASPAHPRVTDPSYSPFGGKGQG
jgi:hypothetical protein